MCFVIDPTCNYIAFRGIRYTITHSRKGHNDLTFNQNESVVDNETFLKNFAVLEELDLEFDLWCYGHQLKQGIKLAKTFPKVRIGEPSCVFMRRAHPGNLIRLLIALNHFGTPINICTDQAVYKEWVADMTELSK